MCVAKNENVRTVYQAWHRHGSKSDVHHPCPRIWMMICQSFNKLIFMTVT